MAMLAQGEQATERRFITTLHEKCKFGLVAKAFQARFSNQPITSMTTYEPGDVIELGDTGIGDLEMAEVVRAQLNRDALIPFTTEKAALAKRDKLFPKLAAAKAPKAPKEPKGGGKAS